MKLDEKNASLVEVAIDEDNPRRASLTFRVRTSVEEARKWAPLLFSDEVHLTAEGEP